MQPIKKSSEPQIRKKIVRPHVTGLVLLLLAGPCPALLAAPEKGEKAENWRYERMIETRQQKDVAAFVAQELPMEVLEKAQGDLDDVRVVEASGLAVPYALRTAEASVEDRPVSGKTTATEKGSTRNVFTFEADQPSPFNQIRIQSPSNFVRNIAVEGSVDGQNWEVVRQGILVYQCTSRERYRYLLQYTYETDYGSFEGTQRVWNLSFLVPESTYKFVRVTIPHDLDKEPVDITKIELFLHTETPASEKVHEAKIVSQERSKTGRETEIILDWGRANIPVARIEFEPKKGNFSRYVQVFAGEDLQEWSQLGGETLYAIDAVPGVRDAESNLEIRLGLESRSRYLKLVIQDGDNRPLEFQSIRGVSLDRFVIFRAEPREKYRLRYGHEGARRPDYDVQRVTGSKALGDFERGDLGPEIENPNFVYSNGKAWTEEKPYLVWIAMGIAGAVMILLALRVIKTAV